MVDRSSAGSADLKPCPFCGSDAKLVDSQDNRVGFFVRCEYCRLNYSNLSTPEKAIALWNCRVTGDAAQGSVETDWFDECSKQAGKAFHYWSVLDRIKDRLGGPADAQMYDIRQLVEAALTSQPSPAATVETEEIGPEVKGSQNVAESGPVVTLGCIGADTTNNAAPYGNSPREIQRRAMIARTAAHERSSAGTVQERAASLLENRAAQYGGGRLSQAIFNGGLVAEELRINAKHIRALTSTEPQAARQFCTVAGKPCNCVEVMECTVTNPEADRKHCPRYEGCEEGRCECHCLDASPLPRPQCPSEPAPAASTPARQPRE